MGASAYDLSVAGTARPGWPIDSAGGCAHAAVVRIDPRLSIVIALVVIVTVIVVPMGVGWIQLGVEPFQDDGTGFLTIGFTALVLLGIGIAWVVRITRDTE
jgi:hypothetical protein